MLPVAVEVQLELDELGTLSWLFRLTQAFEPGEPRGSTANSTGGGDNEEQGDDEDEEPAPGGGDDS